MRKVKKINVKISKKARELYELLVEMEEVSGESQLGIDTPDILHTLDLIREADKISYKLDQNKGAAIAVRVKYKRILGHTVKRILNKDDSDDYCPGFQYLLYALHKRSESYEFHTRIERESSPRVLMRAFCVHLVESVKNDRFPKKNLNISPDSLTDLVNVSLDLNNDNMVSAENTRKVISEVFKNFN